MKLQLENQYTFQEMMGYGDDPEPMKVEHIKEHIEFWRFKLAQLNDSGFGNDELVQLEHFLFCLAHDGDVEFAEPLKEYEYQVSFEYFTTFTVAAASEDVADALASKYFMKYDKNLREQAFEHEGNSGWNTVVSRNYGSHDVIRENY